MLGSRRLSAADPALFVAEIGLNHGGDLSRAKELIREAKQAGAEAVKFQKRRPQELLTKSAYSQPYLNQGKSFGPTYGTHREALEFDSTQYRILLDEALSQDLLLFVSVWDHSSLSLVTDYDLPAVKIASPDLTNEPLLTAASALGKPLFVSTGMSSEQEIDRAVSLLSLNATPFVLFHTVSSYPTPPAQSLLGTIPHFLRTYQVPVGYSGHEMELEIAVAARTLGACVIEKHFTLDRSWKGSDQPISLLPDEFASLCAQVRSVEKALAGIRKEVTVQEQPQRAKLSKSIVAKRAIEVGELLARDMEP